MNTNTKYFVELERTLDLFQNDKETDKQSGELRMLKIPALNIEAFWVHDNVEGGTDKICPIRKFDEDLRFSWNKIYSETEFFAILRDLAGQINQSDDLLGA
jgi:hypothetical protein